MNLKKGIYHYNIACKGSDGINGHHVFDNDKNELYKFDDLTKLFKMIHKNNGVDVGLFSFRVPIIDINYLCLCKKNISTRDFIKGNEYCYIFNGTNFDVYNEYGERFEYNRVDFVNTFQSY